MGTTKRHKGKRSHDGQYTNLPYALTKSPAWRSLSGAAVKVFLELCTRFNGGNNGELHLSLNEAAKALGMGKATAQRAFEELEAKGFIVLTKKGNWYHRQAHEWRITTHATNTAKGRQPATNDWRNWSPKTKRGPFQNPSGSSKGPSQNPETSNGSELEPVRPIFNGVLGSGMEH